MQLTLPKGMSVALPDGDHWRMLGFTQAHIVTTLSNRPIGKSISNAKDDAITTEKTLVVRSTNPVLPTATVDSMYSQFKLSQRKASQVPPELRELKLLIDWSVMHKIRFKVEFPSEKIRYPKSPSYLALALRNIMDLICLCFGFDPDSFVQVELIDGKLVFASLDDEPNSPEFKIKIDFQSLAYAQNWGLSSVNFMYNSKETLTVDLPRVAEDTHANLSEDQAIAVDAEIDNMLGNITDVSDWPKQKIPISLGARQTIYKDWIKAMEESREKAMKELKELEATREQQSELLRQLAEPPKLGELPEGERLQVEAQ